MKKEKKIAIVILNWNGKKDTIECLSSLKEQTYSNYEVILVDNGSTDGSVEAIRARFPKLIIIETGENLGFAGGNNVGIVRALERDATAVLLLNNDTVVAPTLLQAFATAAPSAPILGAKLYLYSKPQTFDHLGGTWNKATASFDLIANRMEEDFVSWESSLELDYACGAALFIDRSVFEAIGLLESKFFLIWEESDFCFRAKRAGFTTRLCPKAHVWHKVSASFVGGKAHSTYFWWRNRLLWIERNCPPQEKHTLFRSVIFPEAAHMLKLFILKSALLYFSPPSSWAERKKNLRKQRAALTGVKDYLCSRFGNGPSWIYKS